MAVVLGIPKEPIRLILSHLGRSPALVAKCLTAVKILVGIGLKWMGTRVFGTPTLLGGSRA